MRACLMFLFLECSFVAPPQSRSGSFASWLLLFQGISLLPGTFVAPTLFGGLHFCFCGVLWFCWVLVKAIVWLVPLRSVAVVRWDLDE